MPKKFASIIPISKAGLYKKPEQDKKTVPLEERNDFQHLNIKKLERGTQFSETKIDPQEDSWVIPLRFTEDGYLVAGDPRVAIQLLWTENNMFLGNKMINTFNDLRLKASRTYPPIEYTLQCVEKIDTVIPLSAQKSANVIELFQRDLQRVTYRVRNISPQELAGIFFDAYTSAERRYNRIFMDVSKQRDDYEASQEIIFNRLYDRLQDEYIMNYQDAKRELEYAMMTVLTPDVTEACADHLYGDDDPVIFKYYSDIAQKFVELRLF